MTHEDDEKQQEPQQSSSATESPPSSSPRVGFTLQGAVATSDHFHHHVYRPLQEVSFIKLAYTCLTNYRFMIFDDIRSSLNY